MEEGHVKDDVNDATFMEYNDPIGIVFIEKDKQSNILQDSFFAFKHLGVSEAFKFSFIYFLDYLVLSKVQQNDLYVAEIAIDKNQRGRGLGTEILEIVIEKAKEKGFDRVILDADLRNAGAIKLYESVGFKKFNKKTVKFLNKERGMYNMEYKF